TFFTIKCSPNLSTGSRVPGNGAKCHKASVLAGLLVQAHSFAQSYPQTAVRIFSPTGSPLPWSLWTKVQPSRWQSADKELENRVMQIIEIINPIFELLRKLAVVDNIRHCCFDT